MAKRARVSAETLSSLNKGVKGPGFSNPRAVGWGKLEVTSSGMLGFDWLIGCGGLPHGRPIELYGPTSGFKTTLALYIVAEFLRQGKRVAFIDSEMTLLDKYSGKCGVDFGNPNFTYAPNNDQADMFNLVKNAAAEGYQLTVLDSLAMLDSGEEDTRSKGRTSALINAGEFPEVVKALSRSGMIFLYTNHMSIKTTSWGAEIEDTPGGKKAKYADSLRISCRRCGLLRPSKDSEVAGVRIRIECEKSKVGVPFRRHEVNFYWDGGFDLADELVALGTKSGVLEQAGAWITYGKHKWNGKDAAIEAVEADKKLFDEVTAAVRGKLIGDL